MKNRLLFKFPFFLAVLCLLTSCMDHDLTDSNLLVQENLPLTGSQAQPSNNGGGIGSMVVKYNKETKILEYAITLNNLSGKPTAANLHAGGTRGRFADLLTSLGNLPNGNSGLLIGTVKIPDNKEDDLLNGLFYIIIQTDKYPSGEIRGQIEFYNQDFILVKRNISITPEQANQAGKTNAIGKMDVFYNKRTQWFSYEIVYDQIDTDRLGIFVGGPAAKGSPGPTILFLSGLNPSVKALSGSIGMNGSTTIESELLSGLYYIGFANFKTPFDPATPSVEIRGQIEF